MSVLVDKHKLQDGENRAGLVAASLLFLSSIVAAFTLSWVVLAPMDFLYGIWHDHGGIREGIEEFAPKNRYKSGFAETTRQQRLDLFSEINSAIHRSGQGLANISYETESSQGMQGLLREPEIVHLQDVANLIRLLAWCAGFNLLFLAALAWYSWRFDRSAFAFKRQMFGLGILVVVSSIVLMAFGPTEVFNQLHIWVFPEEHQWFFYYQESLMSTMMLAPKLFAWIGGALSIMALIFYTAWIAGMNYFIDVKQSKGSLSSKV